MIQPHIRRGEAEIEGQGTGGLDENNPGFSLASPRLLMHALYAVLYGDLMMQVLYRTRPYEAEPGSADRLELFVVAEFFHENKGVQRLPLTIKRHHRGKYGAIALVENTGTTSATGLFGRTSNSSAIALRWRSLSGNRPKR